MSFPRVGQLMHLEKGVKAVVAYKCKKLVDFWSIVYVKGARKGMTECIEGKYIKPYKFYCWNCGENFDSSIHPACPNCHWVICPMCKSCRKNGCKSDRIVINLSS